jgi:hypothetical protein
VTALLPDRSLIIVAWLNVGFHMVGLVFAAFGMRPGTPLVPLAERMEYLSRFPTGWVLGWGTWMLCVPLLIAFLARTARCLRTRLELGRLAVTTAVIGGAFDLCCDVIFIAILPQVASWPPGNERHFLLLEKVTATVSVTIANGLYSIAVLLLTLALRDQPGLARSVVAVGYGDAGFGLVLAIVNFTGDPRHIEWATGPAIGLFCVWAVLVAYSLRPPGAVS